MIFADALHDGAKRFEKKAIKLKRNLWCKNMKVSFCNIFIFFILVLFWAFIDLHPEHLLTSIQLVYAHSPRNGDSFDFDHRL